MNVTILIYTGILILATVEKIKQKNNYRKKYELTK